MSITRKLSTDAAFRQPTLKTVFSGENAWCGEKMMLSEDLQDAVPLATFFSSQAFPDALSNYAARHGGTDRRAIASMWSLYYFSALSIPYIVARRIAEQALPIAFDRMTLALGDDGLPRAFGLAGEGEWADTGETDVRSQILPLVTAHLARAVASLSDAGGLSTRLAWNNAAVYIDYALTATQRQRGPAGDAWVARPLFESPTLSDGTANPFAGCLRHEQDNGATVCRRKICCLRYLLPGIPSCGNLCALPSQRMRSS